MEQATPQILAEPGRPLTLSLRVTNGSDAPLQVEPRSVLPPGWRSVIPPAAVRLEPGEQTIVLQTIFVPAGEEAGVYEVVTHIAAADGLLTSVSHEVSVGERRDLTVYLVSAPRYVLDQPFDVVFAVSNEGNIDETVQLEARELNLLPVRMDSPKQVTLASRTAVEVRVTVVPPSNLARPTRFIVTLKATTGRPGEAAVAATASVEGVAASQPVGLAYRTLDLRVTAAASYESRGEPLASPLNALRRLELGLEGSGPLFTDDDELQLSLSAGLGNIHSDNVVTYRNREFIIELGDHDLLSTPLLPPASGFGISLATPGGRHQERRERALAIWGEDVVAGVEVSSDVNELLQLSFASRVVPGSAYAIGSARFALEGEGGERLSIVAEQGFDMETRAPGFNLELEAESAAYELDGDWSHTALGYSGRDGERQNYGVALRVRSIEGPPLELQAGYRMTKQAPDELNRGATVALRGRHAESSWSLRYLYNLRLDDTDPSRRQEVRLRSRLGMGSITLVPELWWGSEDDLDPLDTEGKVGGLLGLEFPLFSGVLSPGVEASYGLDDRQLDEVVLSLGWWGAPRAGSKLRLIGSVGVLGNEPFEVWAEGSHTLRGGTKLSGKAEARGYRGELPRIEAEFGVSVPFELPLGKRSDVAEVVGTVTDSSGRPLAGTVVWLAGFTSHVNEEGAFRFPAIPPGRHALTLRGVDLGLVVSPALPHVLQLSAGDSTAVHLKVNRPSHIEAEVTVRRVEALPPESDARAIVVAGDELDDATLLSGLIVSLEGPSGSQRAVLPDSGAVRFAHLPPGGYTVNISESSLPGYYRVEPDSIFIDLTEGTSETVEFELVPVTRRIQFQDGGVVGN